MVTTVVRFSLDEILYAGPSHLFRDIADEEASTLTALAYQTYTFLSQNLVGYHLRLTKLLLTQSKSRLLLHQCIGHRFECNHGSLPKTKFFVPIPQYETRLLTKSTYPDVFGYLSYTRYVAHEGSSLASIPPIWKKTANAYPPTYTLWLPRMPFLTQDSINNHLVQLRIGYSHCICGKKWKDFIFQRTRDFKEWGLDGTIPMAGLGWMD